MLSRTRGVHGGGGEERFTMSLPFDSSSTTKAGSGGGAGVGGVVNEWDDGKSRKE